MINVSDSTADRSAQGRTEPGARWSASAAAFTAWRDGDATALEELVRLVSPTLWHVVRATGLDRATAEDVVQSTWLALVDNADKIANPMAVAGWLCTTARRDAWRVSRRSRRERPTDDETLDWALPSTEGPEDGVVLDEDQARLRLCLARLNERCQALLRMLAAGPRPEYAEVSQALDMPVGSIGPTRARCLDKLRTELISEGAS
ncbi:MAG: RNA polymerase sigma factor [Marmoricola sp.]